MGLFRLHSLLKCLLLVTMARGHQHVAWDAHRYRQATTSDLVGHSESFVQLPSLGARRSVQGWQAPLEARVAQLFLEKESYTRASLPAECSKHFRRLYYNTRDCMTPAYYKRCARLLTRLAMSPHCLAR
ncbi:ALK and LTK ligand 1-like [Petromyzon marinus]|uniref:ALK and LTK ligand 1-like n=1 Tax=Petromyzon marinus TaxID=7757 RepID=UPI003F6F714D